tara:strand:+ start:527 stop:991 length:465 start_codon:yes stop_codon:yes gene_type:complete
MPDTYTRDNTIYRKRDDYPIKNWEEREKVHYKKWASNKLSFILKIRNQHINSSRRWWNQTLDHRVVMFLAVNARFNQLPDFGINKEHYSNFVTVKIVNQLCSCSKDTVLKIIKDGIARKDLVLVKNPEYVNQKIICFTAGYPLMQAFSDPEEGL